MSLEDITLPTNKSETRVSNNRRTIRSGEKGLAIKVTLVDANDQPYDLSAFTLEFNEIKDQGKIVFDSGSGDNSGAFNIVDAKGGVFTYTLAPQVYSASGRAWFVVKQGDTIIDTTKDFYFDVLQDATIHIDNDNYVSSMETELDAFKAMTQKEQQNADALIKSLTDQMNQAIADGNQKEADALADAKSKLQALQDATSKLNDNWTTELNTQKQNFTTLQSQWQAQTAKIDSDYADQKAKIQASADQQLTSNKAANDSAIKALNDAKDKAISDANTDFQNKINDLQSDYNDWKTKTVTDFTNKVNDLESKLTADEKSQSTLDAAIKSAQDAVANIKNVDFTKYATKDDLANYYDKATMDTKLAQAGKLKTISVNDATPQQPDNNGNVNLSDIAKNSDLVNINNVLTNFKNQVLPDDGVLDQVPTDVNNSWTGWRLNKGTVLANEPPYIDNWAIWYQGHTTDNTWVEAVLDCKNNMAIRGSVHQTSWGAWTRLVTDVDVNSIKNTLTGLINQKADADKVASLSDNVTTNKTDIQTNKNDIATLQGQQTQTAADVASIKKAVGSGAIAQVKQYTEEQEVQALKDSASGNVLGVFFS